MEVCYNGNVMSANLYTITGRIKKPQDIVLQSVGQKKSCRITHMLKAVFLGIKGSRDGQRNIKMLVSKKELLIHLGTTDQVASKIVIEGSGENGARLSTNGMIILAKSVSQEEANYILTTLNALHTIQNNALKLVMDEHFAKIVIKLRPITDITRQANV